MGISCHKLTKLTFLFRIDLSNAPAKVLAKLSETLESIERLRSASPPDTEGPPVRHGEALWSPPPRHGGAPSMMTFDVQVLAKLSKMAPAFPCWDGSLLVWMPHTLESS